MATRPNKFTNGFTIAEILVALAITGLILAAVAVALNASIINYRENEDIFKTVNSARQALSRITTDVRTASRVFVVDETPEQCSMETADGHSIRYQYYNSSSAAETREKLYLETGSSGIPGYLLCDNVISMTFEKGQLNNKGYPKSVQISMTVESGNTQRTLCAAAVIRRVLE